MNFNLKLSYNYILLQLLASHFIKNIIKYKYFFTCYKCIILIFMHTNKVVLNNLILI